MKILLLGKNGQVGWELQRSLAPLGKLVTLDRREADFLNPSELRKVIAGHKPDWIVNAAAYTAVDKAEEEVRLAYKINSESVGVLAEEASKIGAWLIHYSTDYVYDGEKETEYLETDKVNPLSVYGESKLAGENKIKQSGCKYLIFRTSWVFAAKGNNFAKSMLKFATERETLSIVSDQYGAPTSAELIADVSALCINTITHNNKEISASASGVYHLVASGEATWYSFAKYVIAKATSLGMDFKMGAGKLKAISTSDYPLPAIRPRNSKLNTTKLSNTFFINLPNWASYVDRMLEEIIQE